MKRKLTWMTLAFLMILAFGGDWSLAVDNDTVRVDTLEDDENVALRQISQYVKDGDWQKAYERYWLFAEKFPNKLVDKGLGRYVGVAEFCRQQIQNLPGVGKEIIQTKNNVDAKIMYDRAKQAANLAQMQELVFRFADSNSTDNALNDIGNVYFERGLFEASSFYWLRIIERFPNTDLNKAEIIVKAALSKAMMGEKKQAEDLLERLKKDYADSKIEVNNGEKSAVEFLAAQLADMKNAAFRSTDITDWTMSGGNLSRNARLPKSLSKLVPLWANLGPQMRANPDARVAATPSALPRQYPVVFDGKVYTHNRWQLLCHDIATGKEAWRYEEADFNDFIEEDSYHTTVSNGKVFTQINGRLVALDARTGEFLWRCDASFFGEKMKVKIKSGNKEIEQDVKVLLNMTAPAVAGGNCYVGVTRFTSGEESFLACYDQASGKLLWATKICERVSGTPNNITKASLLAGEGDVVYFSSNLGAVAAVNADTGHILWTSKYHTGGTLKWKDNPPIVAEGHLYVNPSDSIYLYSFDISDGSVFWKQESFIEDGRPVFEYLLGSKDGALYIAGKRLTALNCLKDRKNKAGRTVELGEAIWKVDLPANGATARPAFTDETLYVPTADGLYNYKVSPERAEVSGEYLWAKGLSPDGNILPLNGYLLSASPYYLWCFKSPEGVKEVLEKNAGDPNMILFGQTEALLETGSLPEAIALMEKALPDSANKTLTGAPLKDVLSDRLFDAYARQISQVEDVKTILEKYEKAMGYCASAVKAMRLAESIEKKLKAGNASEAMMNVYLSTARRLGGATIPVGEATLSARYASLEKAAMIVKENPALAAKLDAQAKAEILKFKDNPGELANALASFPACDGTLKALEELSVGADPRVTASYLRLVFAGATTDQISLGALKKLLEGYEKSGDYPVAGKLLKCAAVSSFPETAKFAVEKLAAETYRTMSISVDESGLLALSAGQLWQERESGVILQKIPVQNLEEGRGVLVQTKRYVAFVENATGKTLWKADIPNRASLYGMLVAGGKLVMAVDDSLLSFDMNTGAPAWKAKVGDLVQITNLLLVGDKICATTDMGNFVCLNAADGKVVWQKPAEKKGEFVPGICAVDGKVFAFDKGAKQLTAFDLGKSKVEFTKPFEVSGACKAAFILRDAKSFYFFINQKNMRKVFAYTTDGKELFSAETGEMNLNKCAAGNNGLLVFASGSKVTALNEKGEAAWSYTASRTVNELYLRDNRVFIMEHNKMDPSGIGAQSTLVTCLNVADGKPAPGWKTPEFAYTTDNKLEIVSDRYLVFGSIEKIIEKNMRIGGNSGSFVTVVDALTGEKIWSYRFEAGEVASGGLLKNNRLIFATNSKIYCFGK